MNLQLPPGCPGAKSICFVLETSTSYAKIPVWNVRLKNVWSKVIMKQLKVDWLGLEEAFESSFMGADYYLDKETGPVQMSNTIIWAAPAPGNSAGRAFR
jgi:hypothetical protein